MDPTRPSAPRIEPLPESEWDDTTRAMVETMGELNIFTTLARHPDLLRRWLVFGTHVLMKSTLPARERELAILRVGWRCGSPYEFGQHRVIGRRSGLTDDEIDRVVDGPDAAGWEPHERSLLQAVDELVADATVADDTWAALAERWSTQQLMDLVFTVGQYVLTSMALNTFGVQLEEGVEGFPDHR